MDSHYDQVMKARMGSNPSQVRLYFGYSTALDRQAFDEWKKQHAYDFFELPKGRLAKALDVDLAYDFPSRWWGGRVAGLVDSPGHSVFGILFEIRGNDWPIVQHKEGAVTGMSQERPVRVQVENEVVEATAFETSPDRRSDQGAVSLRFVEALVRGAQSAGLPEAYIQALKKPHGL